MHLVFNELDGGGGLLLYVLHADVAELEGEQGQAGGIYV